MKGPISKDIKVGFGLDGLEVATFIAGVLVVVGLLMESGPEAWTAIIRHMWPHREIAGNALVTIGVFAEVAIGLFIARSAKRAQLQAEAKIAELNSETERLRKENNDTTLLLGYRSVGDLSAFEEAMRPFSGTTYVLYFPEGSNECANLQWELHTALKKAGWINRVFRSDRTFGFGVGVYTVATSERPLRSPAGEALAEWLDSRRVAVISCSIAHNFFEVGTVVIDVGPRPETTEQQEQIRSEYARLKSGTV
jgi:uncharacterized protein YjeT (DUF2065 family)